MSAQVVGLLRMMIIAAGLGLSPDVDSYYLGLVIPSLLVLVVNSWIQLTYLGRYTALLNAGDPAAARAFKLSAGALLAVVMLVVGICWWLFADSLVGLLARGVLVPQAAASFGYLAIMLVATALADFMGQTLNGHQRFALPALAPLVNGCVATTSLYLWPDIDLHALVVSLVLGSVVQLLIITPGFLATGLGRVAIAWQELRTMLRLTLPIVPALVMGNSMLALMQFSTAQLGEGAVSVLGYANRVNGGVAQVLIIGLSTVLIPFFARLVAQRDMHKLPAVFGRLARGTVVASVFLVTSIYLFGEATIAVLFQRGAFSADDGVMVATLLLLLSLALLPRAFGTFVARYFNAERRTDLLLGSSAVAFAATLAGCAAGLASGNIYVLGLVPLLRYTCNAGYWMWALARELDVKPVVVDLLRTLAMGAAVALVLVGLDLWVQQFLDVWHPWLQLGTRAALFSAMALGLGYAMRVHKWVMDNA